MFPLVQNNNLDIDRANMINSLPIYPDSFEFLSLEIWNQTKDKWQSKRDIKQNPTHELIDYKWWEIRLANKSHRHL